MDFATMVDEAVSLERKIKDDTKKLDEFKATLTAAALADMENKNLKFKQIFGSKGIFSAAYKEKFEIDNYGKLKDVLGNLAEDKITRSYEIKYKVDDRFKKALIALFKGEYDKTLSIADVLENLNIEKKKACEKKLKGDYLKDKKVLESFGASGELEEELDAIRRYKNHELIKRYFGSLTEEQMQEICLSIFVEESLAAGIDYEK